MTFVFSLEAYLLQYTAAASSRLQAAATCAPRDDLYTYVQLLKYLPICKGKPHAVRDVSEWQSQGRLSKES